LFRFFFFFISLFFLATATFTDLKQRIVPDKLNYAMLALGIILHVAQGFLEASILPVAFCIAGIAIAFGFAWLLWKAGVWAGGDVKLMIAIAALNPINPNILNAFGITSPSIQLPIFVISLFIFSVFAMLPYGAFISAVKLQKNHEQKKAFLLDARKKIFSTIEYCFAIIGMGFILMYFNLPVLLDIPLLFAFGLLRKRVLQVGIAVAVFAFALLQDMTASLQWLFLLLFFFLGVWLLFKLYFLSKTLLRKKVNVSNLEEGMIVSETFIESNGTVSKAPEIQIKNVINYLKQNRLHELSDYLNPKGRRIVSSARAAGLSLEEIKELQALAKEKKIGENVSISESVPFVPAVLIAYVFLGLAGDFLWHWLFLL